MDDVVAVEITLKDGSHRYVVTWGRIQHRIDPEQPERIVLEHTTKFVGGEANSARLCSTLHAARDAPSFFESLIYFGQKRIPIGRGYDRWRRRTDHSMRQGKELYYLGDPTKIDPPRSRPFICAAEMPIPSARARKHNEGV